MSDRDITEDGFTLPPPPPKGTRPGDPYVKKMVTERELLEKMKAMAPNVAKAIQAEFVKGWKEVQARKDKR